MAFIGLVRSQTLSLFMGFWSGKQQPKVKQVFQQMLSEDQSIMQEYILGWSGEI